MTLVLATRQKGKVQFCTDSRLTFEYSNGVKEYADVGVKLFKIPVKVYANKEVKYQKDWGMAFAGNTTSSYLLKEITQQFLSDISLVRQPTDFAYNICEYILKIHENLSTTILPILKRNGKAYFIIGGFCPNQKQIRTFVFEYDDTMTPPKPTFEEIEIDNEEILMFGSGKDAALSHKDWTNWTVIKVMSKVIGDNIEQSVGGKVQYGAFNDDNNFEIARLIDMEKSNDKWKARMTLNVFDYYEDNFGNQPFSPNQKTVVSNPDNMQKYIDDKKD